MGYVWVTDIDAYLEFEQYPCEVIDVPSELDLLLPEYGFQKYKLKLTECQG